MRKISVILFLVFIIFSCGDKKEKDQKNMQSEAKDPINKNQRYFYNRSIEKVIEDFEKISKENEIDIEKFEKLDFENRNFFTGFCFSDNGKLIISYHKIHMDDTIINTGFFPLFFCHVFAIFYTVWIGTSKSKVTACIFIIKKKKKNKAGFINR